MTLLQAMARMEGAYAPNSRPNRNRNPLDLEYHDWMTKYGATLEPARPNHPARFACFPSFEQGFAAASALLASHSYVGMTLHDALNKWAPPVENDTSGYEKNVVEWTGLSPDTIITPELLV